MIYDDDFVTALGDLASAHLAFQPPQATSVSDAASKFLMVRQPGMAGGPWSATETPYMIEPMDMLASRRHEAVCFAGPARVGKTLSLLLGWMAHAVVCDPGDFLFMSMTQDKAREFSKTDLTRSIDGSPAIRAMLSQSASDRNTHDIMFKNGMWVRVAWPTVSNVSGSTYRYVAITDLDRIPNAENVDGEGPLFSLALKRTTTFLSRGMALVESSPGIEWEDPNWRAATPHEAPPVTGVLGIYNRSDRRRWYWRCPDCREHFEAKPGLGLFNLPEDRDLTDIVRTSDLRALAKQYGARIICPNCAVEIPYAQKIPMNASGIWVPDNCTVTEDGTVVGPEPNARTAGYWLGGVAAAYQSWESLVLRYLQGLQDYALTGSEETLKATTNTDQAMPYMSRHLVEASGRAKPLEDRGEVGMARYVVPPDTRCVVAAVDVQGGSTARFVVQVHAVGPHMEQWLVDRFEIRHSEREGMGQDKAPIDPATYAEDWDTLTEKLLRATWRTPDADREIKLRLLVVDTGGEDGATANSYAWFRRVRAEEMGDRVMLYKGANTPAAPILKLSRVGKRGTKDKGDIPLYLCNPNLLSDGVDAGLRRGTPGPGYLHFPPPKHLTLNANGWLPQAFFDELKAEQRGKDGRWYQIRKRNESFDLCRMIRAGMLRLGLDKIKNWDRVPAWLAPLELNSSVISVEDRRDMQSNDPVEPPVDLAPPTPVRIINNAQRRPRRSAVSPYLK